MFSHMRNVVSKVSNVIGLRNELDKNQKQDSELGRLHCALTYQRPVFLDLSEEDQKRVLDHKIRLAVSPKDNTLLPFNAGYCEAVNAGKSTLNEDCAVALTVVLDSLPKDACACLNNDSSQKDEVVADADGSQNKSSLKNDNLNLDSELSQQLEGKAVDDCTSKDILPGKKLEECKLIEGGDTNIVESPTCIESNSDDQFEDADSKQVASDKPDVNQLAEQMNTNCTLPPQLKEPKSGSSAQKTCKCASNTLRLDYFAIFDGHAGEGAALYASAVLHELLIERIREVQHILLKADANNSNLPDCLQAPTEAGEGPVSPTALQADSLIIGLMQDVMTLTDEHMKTDQEKFPIPGGCTALLVVFVLGRMFVAGAGDSRAVLYCSSDNALQEVPGIVASVPLNDDKKVYLRHMSHDFTPVTERRRLQYLAHLQPSLLGEHFTRLEFIRRITSKDIGKKILHRDYHMTGWVYKEVTPDDVRLPMLSGIGRSKRLLATIGVTRGLGDHNLVALNQLADVPVKPFMSSVPEIRAHHLSADHGPNDVLVMASDGLWDVMTSEMVAKQVTSTLQKIDENDPDRYCSAARDLVLTARGNLTQYGWKTPEDKPASVDDITVMVIPLLAAKRKYL